jgi:hypothetical protein
MRSESPDETPPIADSNSTGMSSKEPGSLSFRPRASGCLAVTA